MNNGTLKILTLILLPVFSNAKGEDVYFNLQLNKHYFLADENIQFSFQASTDSVIPEGFPLYATLMQIKEDHQYLYKAVKLYWNGNYTFGYIPVQDSIPSGNYLLGIFTEHSLRHNIPLQFAYLYIYNPLDREEESDMQDQYYNTEVQSQSTKKRIYDVPELNLTDTTNIAYEIKPGLEKDQNIFTGRIYSSIEHPGIYHLSVTVIDQRFYDSSQNSLIKEINKTTLSDYLRIWAQELADNNDSILDAGNYIQGKLWINSKPAHIKKVYFYTRKDSITILKFYITDKNGVFKFQEPDFGNSYSVKFFTVPEGNNTYSFQLLNRLYTDSIYHLNVPVYNMAQIDAFQNYAAKKYLIDQSYASSPEAPLRGTNNEIPLAMDFSHEIILENYIHFSTLPEIIREIVPLVSIRYRKSGTYQIKVYDARAKDFCCKGNPIIFVNNNPYPVNTGIMNVNTDDIYSIEVVRPVEAITQFGDIGVNGILKINLRPEVNVSSIKSNSLADFQVAGYQIEPAEIESEYINNYPDFRSSLFWDGDLSTDLNGEFQFQFQRSKLAAEFKIVISGSGSDGQFIYKEIDFDAQQLVK